MFEQELATVKRLGVRHVSLIHFTFILIKTLNLTKSQLTL